MKFKKSLKVTGVVVVAIVALQWLAGTVATHFINRILSEQLVPAARLDRISLDLFSSRLGLSGLYIGQPDGFGEGPIIRAGSLRIKYDLWSLVRKPIKITSITLDGFSFNQITDTNGISNISKLMKESTGTAPDEATGEPTVENEKESAEATELLFAEISIRDASISYIDASGDKSTNQVELVLSNLNLDATNLVYSSSANRNHELLSHATIESQLIFRDTPPGYITIDARLGALSSTIPGIVAALTLSGLELDSVDPLVPPGVIATLGGDVLDIGAKVLMATNVLSVKANVITAGADLPIGISGTPDKPQIDSGAILLGAVGRLGGVVGNTVTDVAGAGLEVGKGAVGLVGAVGKGAGNIVLGVGKGLVETTVSAAKLDVKGVGEGLGSSVSAVGKGAVNTVLDAGSNVVSTAGAAGKSAIGGNRGEEWRFNKAERHRKNAVEAKVWVDAAAFPEPANAIATDSVPAQ